MFDALRRRERIGVKDPPLRNKKKINLLAPVLRDGEAFLGSYD